jgi:hypothetical protein
MKSDYSVLGAMLLGLGAIARFIWRWEKTFTDSAIDELKRLREEVKTLREENTDLHQRLGRSSNERD